MRDLKKIAAEILKYKSVAIFSHINTDMDAIGSSLALCKALTTLGLVVNVFSDSRIPENFNFMPYIEIINKKTINNYDLAISLDSPLTTRLGKYENDFLKIKNSINIDHHMDNNSFAKFNYVAPDESSVSYLVGLLIEYLNIDFTDEIAICLLAGIITDTGGFKYSNTTPDTINFVAKLLKLTNIKISDIMHQIFECNSIKYHEIYKRAINSAKFYADNKLVIITIRNKDYIEVGINPEDVYGLTEIGTSLKDVLITIVISEKKPGEFNVSFRGRGIDVRVCAAKFGGGGHKVASGCRLYGNYETVYEKLLKCALDEIV